MMRSLQQVGVQGGQGRSCVGPHGNTWNKALRIPHEAQWASEGRVCGGGLPKSKSSSFAPTQLLGIGAGRASVWRTLAWQQALSPAPSPPARGGLLPRGQQPHPALSLQPFNHGHKVAKFFYADKVSPWRPAW